MFHQFNIIQINVGFDIFQSDSTKNKTRTIILKESLICHPQIIQLLITIFLSKVIHVFYILIIMKQMNAIRTKYHNKYKWKSIYIHI